MAEAAESSAPASGSDAIGGIDEAAQLRQRLEAAEAAAGVAREQYLRSMAELENVRKRAERDVQSAHRYALERFAGERRAPPVIDDNPMYIRDYEKCILCWRCVQVCADDAQYAFAINFNGRGFETSISTFFDKAMPETTCVFCGQCVGVCPTGALKPKREWLLEQGKTPEELAQAIQGGRRKKR